MRHIDLFSGIGGFSLVAQWVWGEGHKIVCFVEMDKFCQKVLNKHWPSVPIVEDVRDVEQILAYTTGERSWGEGGNTLYKRWSSCESEGTGIQKNTIRKNGSAITDNQSTGTNERPKRIQTRKAGATTDLLTGGFPCQGFSVAGKRRGKEDDRYLWPEMFRVIKATRPRWVIGENVTGIVNMALDTVLSDLETEGYTTQAFIIPACAQNAPHRRDRVWITARLVDNSTSTRHMEQSRKTKTIQNSNWTQDRLFEPTSQDVADTENPNDKEHRRRQGQMQFRGISGTIKKQRSTQSEFRRIFDGLPKKLDLNQWDNGEWEGVPRVAVGVKDRVNRLKALGNAIVPQIVIPIMQGIRDIDALDPKNL